MKTIHVIFCIRAGVLVLLLTVTAPGWAGNLSVVGNLSVASNVTASTLTLGNEPPRSTWPGADGLTGVVDLATSALDFTQSGQFYRYTMTGDTPWVLTNHVAGRQIWLQVSEDSTGGWHNSWPADLLWPDGLPMTSSMPAQHFSVVKILDNGSTWLAWAEGLNYAVPCTVDCHYALQFDGSQNYVSVPNNANFYPASGTVEFWVKTPDSTSNGRVILGNENGDSGWWFYTVAGNATVYFNLSLWYGVAVGSISDGQWHHIAATWDGSTINVFLDGSHTASTATSGIVNNTRPLDFGQNGGTQGGAPFSGMLDEVRISSAVRYTNDFDRCSALSPTNDADTVALWHFDTGANRAATDSSNHGNTGTLQGATSVPSWINGATCDDLGMSMMRESSPSMRSGSTSGGTSSSVSNSPTSGSSMTITDTLGRVWGLIR